MAQNEKKAVYLGIELDWLINLILVVIPFTSWILGGLTRLKQGYLIEGILNLIPGIFIIFWILDLYHFLTTGNIKFYLEK